MNQRLQHQAGALPTDLQNNLADRAMLLGELFYCSAICEKPMKVFSSLSQVHLKRPAADKRYRFNNYNTKFNSL